MPRAKNLRKTPRSIPNELEIGGHIVTVRRVVDCTSDEGHALYGYFAPVAKEIVLDKGLEGAELVDTYIHELLEAVNHITNFDLPHYVIQTVATLMAQALTSHGSLLTENVMACVDRAGGSNAEDVVSTGTAHRPKRRRVRG